MRFNAVLLNYAMYPDQDNKNQNAFASEILSRKDKLLSKTADKHLHSKEHLLADDLSRMMGEPKRFGSYLGISRLYHESDLRSLAKYILEKPDLPASARGKYFFACLKGLIKKSGIKLKQNLKKKNKSKRNANKVNRTRASKSASAKSQRA